MSDYDKFLENLAAKESGGRYGITNSIGYLGKYQMGELALIDAGYYQRDGTARNDWNGSWTGKDGVTSKGDFLASPDAQENAVRDYMKVQWGYIRHYGLDKYVGQTMSDGVVLTESGLLAGAHLGGIGNLKDYVTSNGRVDFKDGNGTPISSYVERFGGHETPFEPRVASADGPAGKASDNGWRRVAEQIGPGLKARGYSDEQIATISASALELEAASAQRGPVQAYLLSKDGETVALKHEAAISELKVADALDRSAPAAGDPANAAVSTNTEEARGFASLVR